MKLPQPPLNARDDEGAIPLHILVYAQREKYAAIKLLKSARKKKFEVNAQTDVGETILHICSQQVNSEELLPEMLQLGGIDPTLQDQSSDNFLHCFLRHRRGVDSSGEFVCNLLDANVLAHSSGYVSKLLNLKNETGYLPLSIYVFNGTVHVAVIRKFLKHTEHVDIHETLGHSLLHMAVESAIPRDTKIQTIGYLVRRNANMNIKDIFGRTPLYYATSLPVVKLLTKNGANVLCTDQCKRTPLMALFRSCNPNIVSTL